MINKPLPFKDLNIRIPITIPLKGRGRGRGLFIMGLGWGSGFCCTCCRPNCGLATRFKVKGLGFRIQGSGLRVNSFDIERWYGLLSRDSLGLQ